MTSDADLPAIDFPTLLLSLSTSAMIHLGDATDPSGVCQKNLPLAKQTIDMMKLLKEKTRGNLTAEEDQFLCEQLYTLQLRYVALAGKDP